MGLFDWFGGVGSAVGRTVQSAGSIFRQATSQPTQPMTGRVPIRPFKPVAPVMWGTRYSPRTQSARVSNAGVAMQISRVPQRAALVPNRFNVRGQQVYRKAQTVSTQERVAGDIAAAQERRVDAFLGKRL